MKKLLYFIVLFSVILQAGFFSGMSVFAQKNAGVWPLYHEIVLDETRGWIYGSDPVGGKIDVIKMSDLLIEKRINLPGSAPKGIALSPDGNELAVADYGTGRILFINPDTKALIASVVPKVDSAINRPWDVVYGRPGRLYSSGNPGAEALDYIHVIDTTTHSELGKSLYPDLFRFEPTLVISSDFNTLFTIDAKTLPEKLYRIDVSSDIPAVVSTSPGFPSSDYSDRNLALSSDDQKVFLNTGHVWSSDLGGLLGSTGQEGNILLLPTHEAIAIADDNDTNDIVAFYSTSNYYGIKRIGLSDMGTLGPMAASSDGTKLFVTGTKGIKYYNLANGLPGQAIPRPVGSLPYWDLVIDEARNVLYGSNYSGSRIEVISMSTGKKIKTFWLVNGTFPAGIALSPDGSELAVAQSGASSIIFLNPDNGRTIATIRTAVTVNGPYVSMPFDLIYGRPGRLYMVGNPGGRGFDYIHVIDTDTRSEVGISQQFVRMLPALAISSDKNILYVNESSQLPNQLSKFNVATDDIGYAFRDTNNNWKYIATYFMLPSDESKIFTSEGQVWDLLLRTRIGAFSPGGRLAEIPPKNAFASVFKNSLTVFDYDSYVPLCTFTMAGVTKEGPVVASSDGSMLFVTTNAGIKKIPLSFNKILSTGTQDGWVLESKTNSAVGGAMNAKGDLRVGDDAGNRQYRSILSFRTSILPDTATIQSVALLVKKNQIVGTDPFATHNGLVVDIVKGSFGKISLQFTDFETLASKSGIRQFSAIKEPPNWYRIELDASLFQYISLTSLTQFRLRFLLANNHDNSADFVSFYSGDAVLEADRPILIVNYK